MRTQELFMAKNDITNVSPLIANLRRLRKLDVHENRRLSLPDEITTLRYPEGPLRWINSSGTGVDWEKTWIDPMWVG